jgi:hypothetical protein
MSSQSATNFGGKFKKGRGLRMFLPDHPPYGWLPDEDKEDEEAPGHVEAADYPEENLFFLEKKPFNFLSRWQDSNRRFQGPTL